ncbi:MAG TPA: hypothetical protein VF258_01395, partial [Luteolibacter sp.]
MYDRKTWVVLALCGVLLTVNVYISSKNNQALAAERARQEALQKSSAPKPDVTPTTTAELTVETPAAPATEETITLESKEVIFTLTNIGGGIKHAEFKHQFKVGDKKHLVRVNQYGAGPIGGLAGPGETLENVPYAYMADESIAAKKAVFIAKLPSGLIAKKTFSLVESNEERAPAWWDKILASLGLGQGQEKGAPYLLDFELKLENSAANAINLNQWSLYLGESSPTYQAEVGDQTGFFWRENGSIHFNAGTGFKGGMFGSAKSIMKSGSEKPVEFAGVTNQFFATVIRPKESAITEVWAKPTEVSLTNGAKTVTSVR